MYYKSETLDHLLGFIIATQNKKGGVKAPFFFSAT